MDWRIDSKATLTAVKRVRLAYALIVLIVCLFLVRLFYVQVVNYGHYHKVAAADQVKQYEIPASRGIIYAQQGGQVVPLVLNTTMYTIYADPIYIKNPQEIAHTLAKVLGGHYEEYLKALEAKETRYSVIEKRVDAAKKKQLLAYKYPGIGAQAQDFRAYPDGDLASQLLGFVDNSGKGQYGVEQALNSELSGEPGKVKAVTDVNGVPLVASPNNVSVQPVSGDNVVLTVDLAMQKNLESAIKWGKTNGKAKSVSALILDANTGAVKAMGNYPSYDPANYYNVDDPQLFQNATVSHDIEVGSIMKTLTAAAALNEGVIKPDTTFYDPGHWTIDGFKITDVEQSKGTQSIGNVLNLSLNTGAAWMLMQMGNGKIDEQARDTWHNYMVSHFLLGQKTQIEQGFESGGYIPKPQKNGAGIDLTYANTSFGQAMTATPIQMASALASVVNGGTYYKPRLISQIVKPDGKTETVAPQVVEKDVVSPSTGQGLTKLMQYVIEHHDNIVPQFDQNRFTVGGKTGTAQVAKPGGGGYYADRVNATYLGFVGGAKPKYVIAVFVFDPDTSGYVSGFAGALAAQPIFVKLAHMLIDNGYVAPKS